MALTPSYLQKCTDGIEGEYQKLVTEILVDMAQRIAHAGSMTSTTEYLNAKLRELSLQQEYINRALAKVLNTSESEVEKLMNESTYKSTRDTITQLEKHGYDTSGLSFGRQIEKSTNIAKNELSNLTRTTGQLATAKMMNLYDQAYLQVASGAYSYDQAVTNAIRKLAKEGLGEVTYPTGAKRSVEAAVRVAVRTSVAQNALKCEEDMLDDMDINLVEVSSHLGARPSHAVWQGKIYWRNHPEGNYENFYEATGYGTATGLGGYNCRHQFYPFFGEGDEQTYYHIDETKNEQFYQMEQQQRALERKMRKWDREEKVLKAGGQDTTEARKWKSYYKEKINDLIKSSNGFLKRDYSAEKAWSNTSYKATAKKALASGMKQSGAQSGALNDKNDPHRKRRNAHAERYYESMRNSDRQSNIQAMVSNSGLDYSIVEAAYAHVFEHKHNLENGYTYFDPSYEMSQSWQRLRTNDHIRPYDLVLLKHEALESKIWADHPEWSYWQAHTEAEKTYSYTAAIEEWEKEHTK